MATSCIASTASERKPPITKSALSRVMTRSMALVASGTDWISLVSHAHQLDLALLAADGDAARLVDLVARHLRARPLVLSLGEGHGAEHRDLDCILCESGGRHGEEAGRGDDEQANHGVSRVGIDPAARHFDSASDVRRAPTRPAFRTSKRLSGRQRSASPPAAPGCRSRRRRRGSRSSPGRGRRSACGSRRSPAPGACGTAGRARARRGRCCRRSSPYSCSISYGPITCRCRIELGEARARPPRRGRPAGRRTRRARRVCGAAAHSCGTHCVNIDMTCLPSGASVGSNTDGMQMSANGTRRRRGPATASWNARSTSSSDSASTIVPPCTSGSKPGLAVNSGSRSTARLTFTVPAAGLPALDVGRRSRSGSSARSICSRKVIFGCVAATTDVGAQLLADLEHDARARGRRARRCAPPAPRCGSPRRSDAPRRAQALRDAAHAAFGEAPRARAAPSPTSPILWCAITYAVPGERGPAHVPITPADRQHAAHLRRLEVLVEQVGDAHREQPGHVARRRHAEPARAPGAGEPGRARSRGRCEPSLGGTWRAAARARRRGRGATRPSARSRRRRAPRTSRSARAGAGDRRRAAAGSGRRGRARSSRAAGRRW